MPIVLVQSKNAATASVPGDPSLMEATFDSTPTVGNFITVATGGFGGGDTWVFAISDNKGNTYSVDKELHNTANTGHHVCIASAQVTSSSATFTVTVSRANPTPNDSLWIYIQEWSGIVTSSALDKTTSTDSSTVNNATVDTATTAALAQADELVIAVAERGSGAGGVSWLPQVSGTVPASGWTQAYTNDGSSGTVPVDVETVIVSDTAGVRHVWTMGSALRWQAVLATYRGLPSPPMFRGS
jgi:hypothetical protein